jgi:hypothetical protein
MIQLTFDDMPALPPQSRADQIFGRFTAFYKANPQVWTLFKGFTNELIAAGFDHYSVDAVFQRIRWHVNIETKSEDGLKLNDHYRAYYARLYAVAFPQHDGFYRIRRRISAERPAEEHDLAVFNTGQAENETALFGQLRDLLEL